MPVTPSTITEDLDIPGGDPVSASTRVVYRLIDAAGLYLGEASDADGNTIMSHRYLAPSSDGTTTVSLVGNNDISPSGTHWQRLIDNPYEYPTAVTTRTLLVPTDGATYTLKSRIV